MWSLLKVVGAIAVAAIPLAITVFAMLDAARRPEWVFSFANRNRTAWVAANAVGVLFCLPGLLISLYYLRRVRPQLVAIENGDLS